MLERKNASTDNPVDATQKAAFFPLNRYSEHFTYRVFITDLTGLVWTLDYFLPEILFFIVAVQVLRTAFSLGSSGESRRFTVLV